MPDAIDPRRTIQQSEYDYLVKREAMLTALEEAGVDNWIGFEEAFDGILEEDIV